MSNTFITCAYTLTAVGGLTIAELAPLFGAVPLDLTIPRGVGLSPVSDVLAAPVGSSVTRTITFRMVPTVAAVLAITIKGASTGFGPIATVTGSNGAWYAKPPILGFGTPGANGQATAIMNISGTQILHGGSGYTGATTVSFVGGDLIPGVGVEATGTPVIVGGVINGVAITSQGNGYQTYPDVVFSDTGGGSGASGIGKLAIIGVQVNNPGDGYTDSTPVTVSPVFPVMYPDSSGVQLKVLQGWMLQEFMLALKTTAIVAAIPVVS